LLSVYLTKLAQLGRFLARAEDSSHRNGLIWRGMTRLTDIELGFTMGAELASNWTLGTTLRAILFIHTFSTYPKEIADG